MIRLALVCDFIEEGWPSMDHVADMLFSRLSTQRQQLEVFRLRPAMRQRFSRFPFMVGRPLARNCDRLTNRFFDYPRWLKQQSRDFDLFHIIDHSYSQLVHELPLGRTVVTCHDLDTFRCLLHPSLEPRSLKFRLMVSHILNGLAKAGHVLCVSETIRQELLNLKLLPDDRVSVVFNGVDQCFSTKADDSADAKAALLVKSEERPYLLSVGSAIPRKRLEVLLRVFADVREVQPIRLVRVGGPFTAAQENLIDNLGIRKSITVLPFLSRAVLASVYRSATLTILTSETEGFGLPLVEAMSCGCPVVASDIPVLREIGGHAAAFCPVGDVTAWSRTVTALLRERKFKPLAWEQRRSMGSAWVSRFTWEEAAAKCMQIYNKVIENRLSTSKRAH